MYEDLQKNGKCRKKLCMKISKTMTRIIMKCFWFNYRRWQIKCECKRFNRSYDFMLTTTKRVWYRNNQMGNKQLGMRIKHVLYRHTHTHNRHPIVYVVSAKMANQLNKNNNKKTNLKKNNKHIQLNSKKMSFQLKIRQSLVCDFPFPFALHIWL